MKYANINVRTVPRPLRDQFKAYCARRGKSMQEKIVELIHDSVQEENNAIRDQQAKEEIADEV